MNLYFRLLKMLVRFLFFSKYKHPLDTSIMPFRALPLDCDYNLHVTNARYLSFMDLGRSHLTKQAGILSAVYKRKWLPIATSVEISFFREIKPFQKFFLHSQLITWDEKYWYIRQDFKSADTLHATAMVRGVFINNRKKVPFQKVVDLLDSSIQAPEEPATVTAWKRLLEAKKELNLNPH